ncbi:MAG: hypothetical protein K2G86_05180, partial [Prevotella sp.]|nr:hypothetical protein [Prevotella sp.]
RRPADGRGKMSGFRLRTALESDFSSVKFYDIIFTFFTIRPVLSGMGRSVTQHHCCSTLIVVYEADVHSVVSAGTSLTKRKSGFKYHEPPNEQIY